MLLLLKYFLKINSNFSFIVQLSSFQAQKPVLPPPSLVIFAITLVAYSITLEASSLASLAAIVLSQMPSDASSSMSLVSIFLPFIILGASSLAFFAAFFLS